MFEITQILAFAVAAFVVIIAPGPVVTVVIANALRHGAGAGLATVSGALLGLAPLVILVAVGLDAVATSFGALFEWVRILGALYLLWLGAKLILSGLRPEAEDAPAPRARSFFAQGFVISISNPKALLFLGAFLPQFVQPERGDPMTQALLLGFLFIFIAAICDSAYAFGAGRAGGWLRRRRQTVELTSGGFMVAGGLWMALRGRV